MLDRLRRIVAVALFLEDEPLPRRDAGPCSALSRRNASCSAFSANIASRLAILLWSQRWFEPCRHVRGVLRVTVGEIKRWSVSSRAYAMP